VELRGGGADPPARPVQRVSKSVILRANEARDLDDVDRYSFYDHLKAHTAVAPDVLRIDEKNIREYVVWNVCGVVITSNHKSDGLYLPGRRSPTLRRLDRGRGHLAAYLAAHDLSDFDPKAPRRRPMPGGRSSTRIGRRRMPSCPTCSTPSSGRWPRRSR
jgi:hypothetical protein